jgi:nucleoside-diphosphate-sugar epimerase
MKVLLTGHRGYIGTVLAPMLLDEGYEVIGLDSDLYNKCTFGDPISYYVPSIIKDIRDVDEHDLEGVDAVLHLAGLSNDPLGDLNPELTKEINYRASVKLARIAKKVGVSRYIFSSSCSNYGAGGNDFLDENSELRPVTPYGESKVLVEKEVSKLADDNFSPVFLRNATAYGASPRIRFDLVLNNLVAYAYTTGQVYLKSDGTPWRPIVHIEDISRAFIAALKAPKNLIHNQKFNVGQTTENYRIREIAEIVRDTVPGSRIQLSKQSGPDKRNYRVNCDKIINTLPDFNPQWNARKGAQQLYESYKRFGIKLEDFEGPRYRRITHIKRLIATGELNNDLRWNKIQEHQG